MWSFFKKKRLMGEPLVKSSRSWRELYAPPLIETLKVSLNTNSIKEMYLLLFFLANDENLNVCIENIAQKNYRRLSEMNTLVPMDYDEVDYLMYDLVYINCNEKKYFAIVHESGQNFKKEITLNYITEAESVDLTRFLGRLLVFPI